MEKFNKKLEIGKLIKKRDKMIKDIYYWKEWVNILEIEKRIRQLQNK